MENAIGVAPYIYYLAVQRYSRFLPSPLYSGERGWGVRGKRRKETPKPLAFTKPLTPGPSPLNTGERGVALYC